MPERRQRVNRVLAVLRRRILFLTIVTDYAGARQLLPLVRDDARFSDSFNDAKNQLNRNYLSMSLFGPLFAALSLLTPHLWFLYAVFAILGLIGPGTSAVPHHCIRIT